MPEKSDLSKLIKIIDEIIKNEKDNWFSSQLLDVIGHSVDFKSISSHSVIKEIHEYCIEDILNSQAREFYKDLPLENSIHDRFCSGFSRSAVSDLFQVSDCWIPKIPLKILGPSDFRISGVGPSDLETPPTPPPPIG